MNNDMDYIFEYYKKFVEEKFDVFDNICNEKITKTSLFEGRIYVQKLYNNDCYCNTNHDTHLLDAICIYTHFDANIISDDETIQKNVAKKNCYNYLLNLGLVNA
jgi:hypothetical protein